MWLRCGTSCCSSFLSILLPNTPDCLAINAGHHCITAVPFEQPAAGGAPDRSPDNYQPLEESSYPLRVTTANCVPEYEPNVREVVQLCRLSKGCEPLAPLNEAPFIATFYLEQYVLGP